MDKKDEIKIPDHVQSFLRARDCITNYIYEHGDPSDPVWVHKATKELTETCAVIMSLASSKQAAMYFYRLADECVANSNKNNS